MEKEFMNTTEAAARFNRHPTLVRKWCRQGRIPGAYMLGRDWLIPKDALKPSWGRPGRRYKAENLEKKLEPIVDKLVKKSLGIE